MPPNPIEARQQCDWPVVIRFASVTFRQQGDKPFDYAALRAAYEKAGGNASWMVNNGYDRQLAIDTAESGKADLIAFGKPFIANPDLVERLEANAPLNEIDQATLYGGGPKGYIDYPALEKVA